jgi:hypothetical protein
VVVLEVVGTPQLFNLLEVMEAEAVVAEAQQIFHLTLEDKVFLELMGLAAVVEEMVLVPLLLALTLAAQA